MREAGLDEVRAALSAVVGRAAEGEGTVVTRDGRPRAVVLGHDEWVRLRDARRPTFADLLLAYPSDGGLAERDRTPVRDPFGA